MDDEIVKAEGTSIPEIFKRGGEEEFRAIEHRLLEKFSKESGRCHRGRRRRGDAGREL